MLSNDALPVNSRIISDEAIQRFKEKQGYVYLVHAEGTNRYKIGRSVNPVARLETLKGQSPYPLRIINSAWTVDATEDELKLHEEFKDYRVYGEWFEFPERVDHAGALGVWDNIDDWFAFRLFHQQFEEYSGRLERIILNDLSRTPDSWLSDDESLQFRIEIYQFISCARSTFELLQCFTFLENDLVNCLLSTSTDLFLATQISALRTTSLFIFKTGGGA